MDPRHGKRPLPSSYDEDHEQEKKEEEQQHHQHNFSSFYTSTGQSDQDLSAMVSALSRGIGTSPAQGGRGGGEPEVPQQYLPSDEYGMHIDMLGSLSLELN